MKKISNFTKANKYFILFWIFLLIPIFIAEPLLAEICEINLVVKITLFAISLILFIAVFMSFGYSIRKQKISYFIKSLLTGIFFILLLFISFSGIGTKIINGIRGEPKITATFRGTYLVLRKNSNFDIWKPALLNRNIISSGTYKINDDKIFFTYKCEIPAYYSTYATIYKDESNGGILTFYFPDSTRFHYYIINN